MPYTSSRGAGGGEGFILGVANNVFATTSGAGQASLSTLTPATNRAAAESTREAYDTANPTWIANYTDVDVNIILYYVSGSSRFVQYQRRIGTNWVDNGPAVLAVQGEDGAAVSLANVSTNAVPMKNSSGELDNSGIEIVERGTVRIPEATLGLGELVELSEGTGFGVFNNAVTGLSFVILDAQLSQSTGSARPRQFVIATPSSVDFESGGTDNLTANPLSFDRATTLDGATFTLTFTTGAAMNNAKMRLIDVATNTAFKHIPSRLAWDDDAAPGFNLRLGTNTINLFSKAADDPANGIFNIGISPLVLTAGRNLRVEIKADTVNMIGDSGTGYPNFSGIFGAGTFSDIAYLSDVPSSGFDGVVDSSNIEVDANANVTLTLGRTESLPDLTTSFRLIGGMNVTLDVDEANDTITINGPGGIPTPGQDEEFYHGLSASNNPASIDVATLTQEDVGTGSGQEFTFSSGTATSGQYLILLVPAAHDITTIINTGTNINERPSFTRTANVRQISSENYNSYVLGPLVANFTASYRVTLA